MHIQIKKETKEKVKKSKLKLETLICPSMPVAAATSPIPPLGSLANSFAAYALRTLWKTYIYLFN